MLILFTVLIMLNVNGRRTDAPLQTAFSKEQVNKIAGKLIAPCCWKQTADVHPSASSDKIKAEIENLLLQGKTEEEIINRFVAEYGERIRAIPQPSGFNLMLWIMPSVILIISGLALVLFLRFVSKQKKALTPPLPMDESELNRVEKELKELDA